MQPHSRLLRIVAWIAIAAFGTNNALAAAIQLATSPLVTGISKNVAPNVFFILDDSASMPEEYMPDSVSSNSSKNCYRNFGYNTIYYNPSTTYSAPVKADGTSYADSSFTSAHVDGYDTGSTTTDLSLTSPVMGSVTAGPITLASNPLTTTNGNKVVSITHAALPDGHVLVAGDQVTLTGVTGSGSPAKLNNIPITAFNGQTFSITSITDSTHFKITVGGSANATASTAGGGSPVKATYTYTGVVGSTPNYYYYSYTANPTSPATTCASDASYTQKNPAVDIGGGRTTVTQEKTNFANWYTYYRTRLLMMKTASGRAFSTLTDKYRVGFTVTSDTGMASGKFIGIKKFDSTQRTAWYNALYNINDADTFSGTPLRGALSKAGRYFAGTLSGALAGSNTDPIQYSCQQNFNILATDGFWNTYGESTTGTRYGPYKEDNSTLVGDQDSGSTVPRPYKDQLAKSNTLADVAYYYYNKDLRPTAGALGGLTDENTHIDVSTDNVPTSNTDTVSFQHMTTYTMGLGVSDQLAYPTDYANILAGTKNWPDPSVTNTGVTVSGRVDDLWHAGINGHGQYFSAKDPVAVENQLTTALQSIRSVIGASSAAATSNLQPVNGDNTAFIAQYKTVAWTGDVVARTVDVITGAIPTTNTWSAQALLDAQTTRNIYTYSTAAADSATKLRAFTAAKLTAEISAGYFKSDSGNPGGALPQYSGWSTAQVTAADQTAMINYIRGVRTNEDTGGALVTDLFRQREHVLGDIVSAAPVFVRKPPFAYTDAGYTTFLANQTSRAATVYVGANDGMLHAFDGTTGQSNSGKERWAYIPSMLIKNLYKLSASDYSLHHGFYVDGPITAGDAYSGTAWATILVGGLGAGGKGYYALDVTDPANPKTLWEFGTTPDYGGDTSYDADIGYSYGNPIITKRASDGKWVVIFASGYNNSTGDKKGRLYVVDAFTGEKLSEIVTTTTANEDLSGIARIANYVEDGLKNNVTQYVYGGDLNGSLWRFDINAATVQHMGDTSATAGAQPITVQPELAKVSSGGNWYTVVYFGTGRYLSLDDLNSTLETSASAAQGIYAVKDTNTYLGVLTSSAASLVSQTLDTSTSPRTSTATAVDWTMNNGWYVTTPAGERFDVDPGLQLGTLVIASNIPTSDYCKPTGSSVLYQLSYTSGAVLTTNVFQAQIVGNTQLQLGGSGSPGSVQGGKIVIESVLADGTTINTDQKNGGGAAGSIRRISWREIE